jgi:hypothetical protein
MLNHPLMNVCQMPMMLTLESSDVLWGSIVLRVPLQISEAFVLLMIPAAVIYKPLCHPMSAILMQNCRTPVTALSLT